jgi:hypothetical protein
MPCPERSDLEQHLLDVRTLTANRDLAEEKTAAMRAIRFATELLKEHDAAGHDGKRCPAAGDV